MQFMHQLFYTVKLLLYKNRNQTFFSKTYIQFFLNSSIYHGSDILHNQNVCVCDVCVLFY